MDNEQQAKINFALERLSRSGSDALGYHVDLDKVKRHVEQALKVRTKAWSAFQSLHLLHAFGQCTTPANTADSLPSRPGLPL